MTATLLTISAALISTAAAASICGNATLQPVAGYPNVLIVGDSISMAVPYTPGGYGVNVQNILEPKGIPVQHAGGWYAGGQCSNTVKGLNCTDATTPGNYLDFNGIFDVIHFNYGLHDLENCNSTECSEHVEPVVYGQNLVTIYRRLAAKANTVIFATTTPVPNVTTSYGRTYELAVEYNTVALKALQGAVGSKLIVDDLWTTVINVCGTYYTNCTLQIPANVHFEPAGQQVLGQQVANTVLKNLELQGWRQEKSGKWTKST